MDAVIMNVHNIGTANLGATITLALSADESVSGTLVQARHYMRGQNRWTELTLNVMGVNLKYRMKRNVRKPTTCSIITQYTTVK